MGRNLDTQNQGNSHFYPVLLEPARVQEAGVSVKNAHSASYEELWHRGALLFACQKLLD